MTRQNPFHALSATKVDACNHGRSALSASMVEMPAKDLQLRWVDGFTENKFAFDLLAAEEIEHLVYRARCEGEGLLAEHFHRASWLHDSVASLLDREWFEAESCIRTQNSRQEGT
jgi:hypothetical protein